MEDVIKNWIKKKLDSTEDIHIHIIQYDYGIDSYLVAFIHEGILKTLTIPARYF